MRTVNGSKTKKSTLIKISILEKLTYLFMWYPRRSAGFHLVSPSSLLVPGPLSSFVCRGVGGTEPGIEILLLTLKGRKSSWGACKCLSVFFMRGGLCGSCAQAERLGICCCFYGTADSHRAPPRHLLGRLRVRATDACTSFMRREG